MKGFLKENWFKIGLLVILVISIAGAFYWYSLRPYLTIRYCSYHSIQVNKTAIGEALNGGYDATYKLCIQERGL